MPKWNPFSPPRQRTVLWQSHTGRLHPEGAAASFVAPAILNGLPDHQPGINPFMPELMRLWRKGELTAKQAAGYVLQHLERRLRQLEQPPAKAKAE